MAFWVVFAFLPEKYQPSWILVFLGHFGGGWIDIQTGRKKLAQWNLAKIFPCFGRAANSSRTCSFFKNVHCFSIMLSPNLTDINCLVPFSPSYVLGKPFENFPGLHNYLVRWLGDSYWKRLFHQSPPALHNAFGMIYVHWKGNREYRKWIVNKSISLGNGDKLC